MKQIGSELAKNSISCAIAFVFVASCQWVRAADVSAQEPVDQPTATELLDKYAAALDQFRSVIIKAEKSETYTNRLGGLMGSMISGRPGTVHGRLDYRTDGKRFALQYAAWGDCSLREVTPEHQAGYGFSTWDGQVNYWHTKGGIRNGEMARISSKTTEDLLTPLNRNAPLAEMRGYLHAYRQRLDVMVRRGRAISVRPRAENVNGSACYAIDAITDHGSICLWIDPAHGYQAARIEVSRFEQKGEVWVPMEMKLFRIADMTATREFQHSSLTYKCTEIELNPDHNSLHSFDWKRDPELKEGTHLQETRARGAMLGDYLWQGGKLVRDPSSPRARP